MSITATAPDFEASVKAHTQANRSPLKVLTLILPVGYSVVFFLVPLIFLVALGFWTVENYQVTPAFSLSNYSAIWREMFAGSRYGLAIAQSAYVSATTAILAVLLCYPFVLGIVYLVPQRLQRLVLLLAIAPFWTSYILRVFAWQILLAKRGIINTLMQTLGWENFQQSLLNTQSATRIGLIHYEAPILIVILYITLSNIDSTLIEASRELGASRWQTFRRVILPLSRVGIVLSLSFATIISFGDVLSATLLGGGAGPSILGSLPLFSTMIMNDYASSTNLPRTSVLAMIMVLIMVMILVIGLFAAERAQKSIS
jgi:ABC-type spermidine/putrescine transport system permease subunit I